jgi:hypothetical protein
MRHNLWPWEVKMLPLGMYRWMDPVKTVTAEIENSH